MGDLLFLVIVITDHSILLELVKNWPPSVYDAAALLRAIGPRAGPTSSFALRRSAAALHSNLGEHEAALRLLLDLKLPEAFEYIRANAVAPAAAPLAPQLIALDEVRGTSLLVDCWEEAPPAQVVAALQRAAEQEAAAAVAAAPAPGGREAVWPLRLYHYLDWLWQREPAAAAPFAATHVELCALYDPARLLHLLTSSSTYPLDAALEVCERQGLVRESVYVLGRMGSSDAALRLIVGRLRDVAGAVAFVQEQHDDELWELLISLTLGDAALAGELLDHAGGAVDPLRVVGALPEDMAIDRLRDRLVRIIGDFKAVMSLQQGCNAVLKADCLELADELYSRLRRAMRRVHMMRPGGRWVTYDALAGENEEESVPTVHIPDGTAQRVWVEIRPATPGGKGPRQVTPPVSVHSSPSKYPKRSPRRDARR